MKLERYYEDFNALHINEEPVRSSYKVFDEKGEDASILLSSSDWLFSLFDSPEDLEEGFDSASFAPISVPSSLETLGYLPPQYCNVDYPIPYNPPYVPVDNPTGLYKKKFLLTKEEDKSYYLYLEGVDSAYYVYLNGSFIGYSEVPHSPTEFDITKEVNSGENELIIIVLKYSKGTYLENQDKFRFSGIFRDVSIIKRAKNHVQDFTVTSGMDGAFSLRFDRIYGPVKLRVTLSDLDGTAIFKKESAGDDVKCKIENVKLWNAEEPNLYLLIIESGDETIVKYVGFRTVSIKNNTVLFNGKAVKFMGSNHHESSPYGGAYTSLEELLTDIKLMKEGNMNTVRTSHYPASLSFYTHASEQGLYVISEADAECHGVVHLEGGEHQSNFDTIARDERFFPMILDRNMRNVIVNKNCPAIFMWSLGNESGWGENFVKTAKWVKSYDETRLVHYEGSTHSKVRGTAVDDSILDVESFMYPEIDFLSRYEYVKPVLISEYMHSMGNSAGDAEPYFEAVMNNPMIMGAEVWELCDHAVFIGHDEEKNAMFIYGGDSGEYPHDGNFCLDGLLGPDRRAHSAYYEYKNVLRPVRSRIVGTEKGKITIAFKNMLYFKSLSHITALISVKRRNAEICSIEIPLSAEAGDEEIHSFDIPYEREDTYLNIRYADIEHDIIRGLEQHIVERGEKKELCIEDKGWLKTYETAKEYVISGESFTYRIDKRKCIFTSLIVDGKEILLAHSKWTIWRAPLDNDRKIKEKWREANYEHIESRAVSSSIKAEDGIASLSFDLRITPLSRQTLLYITLGMRINGEGKILLSLDGKMDQAFPYLPRFSHLFTLKSEGPDDIEYFGYGPNESYVDKHQSSILDLYRSTCDEMGELYIRPQESGSRYAVTYLKTPHLSAESSEPFSFNASHYSVKELESKAHNWEAVKDNALYLHLDYKMSGIGSSSCGVELLEKYRLKESTLKWSILISFR